MLITMVYLLMVIVIVFVKYIKDNNIEGSNITVFFYKESRLYAKGNSISRKGFSFKDQ